MVQALPSALTSLYRLFLRTASTSVLHHRGATRNLRKLWRPTFVSAVQVIRQLEQAELGAARRAELEKWYATWDQRMDNTLALLCSSSLSRGLPHRLTRNLALLILGQHQRLSAQPVLRWKPELIGVPTTISKKEEKQARWDEWDENAWAALGEVVSMAEARQKISLGRVTVRGSLPRRKT
ncbi:hypothetical protein HGRIS_001884 [Hohenbuehelia grisea]|uniref:ATP synthase protein MI25 n=1 Tax=Hohenbuehelia grisea TaxID=104357 RepID=A0ABR3JJG6_9AGAR